MTESQFERRVRERREAEASAAPQTEAFNPDDVPEVEYQKTQDQINVDKVVEGIPITWAYRRWCGKMEPKVHPGQKESVMIRCPIPGHEDRNPSAWMNLEKNVWHCAACDKGGDGHDLAAFYYGMSDYKTGKNFADLRERMAVDYGYKLQRGASGTVAVKVAEPEEVVAPNQSLPEPPPVLTVVAEPAPAPVISLYDTGDEDLLIPTLDYGRIVEPNTFLDIYMKQTNIDDVSNEFHLWNGLAAIGLVLGRDVTLKDRLPVYGNLFICTLGRSGAGKTTARGYVTQLLRKAVPYDHNNPNSKGVKTISNPGSGEALIQQFQKQITDPSNSKIVLFNAPVRGFLDFSELSSLVGRGSRQGSVLKPTLMEFYDNSSHVSTTSLTSGTKTATEAFATAITTTQTKALRTLVSSGDDASGFLNRWVFVVGQPKVPFAVGGVTVDVDPCVKPLQRILGWGSTFKAGEHIGWTPEAIKMFSEFFYDRIVPDKKAAETDLIVRIDLTLKKLMLLLAANRMEQNVSEETVARAIMFYDYLVATYGLIDSNLDRSMMGDITEALLKITQKGGTKGASMRDFQRSALIRKYPVDLIVRSIESLIRLDILSEEKQSGSRGRPTVRYIYNAS